MNKAHVMRRCIRMQLPLSRLSNPWWFWIAQWVMNFCKSKKEAGGNLHRQEDGTWDEEPGLGWIQVCCCVTKLSYTRSSPLG